MKEIEEMEKEKQEAASEKKVSIRQLFTSSKYRQAVIVALMVQISQQFSGINAVSLPKRFVFQEIHAEQERQLWLHPSRAGMKEGCSGLLGPCQAGCGRAGGEKGGRESGTKPAGPC